MFRFFLLSSLLLLFPTHSLADKLFQNCSTRSNYTANSAFESNLKKLLPSLSSNAIHTGFYKTNRGQSPDRVYALFLCRGDVSPTRCGDCIEEASQTIIQACPDAKEAFIWNMGCFLRYSNLPIVSDYHNAPKFSKWNELNVSNPKQFRERLEDLINNLAFKAALSHYKFATGEMNFTSGQNIYGLVQCVPDLSQADCNRCLQADISEILERCLGSKGGRIYGPSCNLRYETYPFSGESDATPGAALAPRSRSSKTTTTGKRPQLKLIIFITLGGLLVVLLLSGVYYYVWGKKRFSEEKKKNSQVSFLDGSVSGGHDLKTQDLTFIDFDIVQAATNNFSDENKLGEGGFGPVYKGVLPDGKEVAVKRLSKSSGQGLEEFKNEINLIAKLQHRNLVRLLFGCIEKEEKLLIYEYMPNTSLDIFLFDGLVRGELNWETRFRIIRGIAKGLLYLHEDSRLKIIHRDLKASNVLLDDEMNPKISDFGMARIFSGNEDQANTRRVVGTYGYMAPEYALEGLFSVKSDVFSFGVLMLELVSGKRNSSFHLFEHAQSLLTYAWRLWTESKGHELIDPSIIDTCSISEALRCIHIGLLCLQVDPDDRPTMSSVVLMLGSESICLPQPTAPAYSVGRGRSANSQPVTSAKSCSLTEIKISVSEAR